MYRTYEELTRKIRWIGKAKRKGITLELYRTYEELTPITLIFILVAVIFGIFVVPYL